MGRLRLHVLTACTALSIASPALAAEITRVTTSGESKNPFDVDFSVRWDRVQEKANISREQIVAGENPPYGSVEDLAELRYREVRNAIVNRLAVGLWRDVELHLELPYVLADDATWRFGTRDGVAVDPISSISNETIDANGSACATQPCPIFAVAPSTTGYHGTVLGDVMAGLSWGIFSDRRDDTKPFWLVGLDVTMPTARRYDPGAGRDAVTFLAPSAKPADPAPVGEKAWKFDLYTAMSRRMGPIDPYFKAHLTVMRASNDTYSNCEHATELAAASTAQFSAIGAANCELPQWEDEAGAKLPFLAGLAFGTEIVPFEDVRQGKKVTIDVRLVADYTSRARWYNELSDATGKILWTQSHVTFGGQLGVVLRASRFVSLQANASLATTTPHYLTGETLGTPGGPAQNPNFDWRYDAPGGRFRLTDVTLFGMSVMGVLQY